MSDPIYNVCAMGDYNGHLYKVITYPKGRATWDHAKEHAESMEPLSCGPPHLVTITSQGESDFITSLLQSEDGACGSQYDAWIGIINAGNDEDEFDWVAPDTGNNDFTNWCPGQPSQNGEPVGEVWLDQVSCSNTPGPCTNPFGCWNDNEKNTNGNANGADNDKYILEYECMMSGQTDGDPHFQTWMSNSFWDFQGECDLNFVDAPHFAPDLGFKIDIRTTIRYEYSFIETTAIKIGDDVLEISGYADYAFNGVATSDLPATVGSLSLTHDAVNKKTHYYELATADEATKIVVKTHKDLVSVKIEKGEASRFADSKGILGDFTYGKMLGRNGTVIEDHDAYAMDWQVREDEPMLFQSAREPQHPRACRLPEHKTSTSRRLGESIALESAKKACAHVDEGMRAACVHDVMSTGDLEFAESF